MIIAIDPGHEGALAAHPTGAPWQVYDTPIFKIGSRAEYNVPAMVSMIEQIVHGQDVAMVVIESIGKRPGQSVQSMVTTGYGHGLWRGILAAAHLPLTVVSPQRWQAATLGKVPKGESKDHALRRATEIAPDVAYMTARGKKLYGRSDAVCMAWWYETIGGKR